MPSRKEQTIPLLGFDGEYRNTSKGEITDTYLGDLLFIPTAYGDISVYTWSGGEGYNLFFPHKCPMRQDTLQATDLLTVKMLIQDYLNRLDHFITSKGNPQEKDT